MMEKPTAKKAARIYSRLTTAEVWEFGSGVVLEFGSSEVMGGGSWVVLKFGSSAVVELATILC